ncbi:MAG: phosphatase PAP2 family protein [Sphingobacteriaceae bacterium]|nr:MAG: phosphatase PAP2 family protein [Sphingobacteriaceae bacterium]
MRIFTYFLILLFLRLNVSAQSDSANKLRDTSFIGIKSATVTGKGFKPFILPTALLTYGSLSLVVPPLKNLNHAVRNQIINHHPNFSTHADDYLRFVPTVAVYGLNLAGLHGQNNYRDLTMIVLISNIVTKASTQIIKKSVNETRPDGSDQESFPSGHTSIAFASAEYLYQEYKTVSPWIGIGGYAVAGATGILRLYNNKHYLGDVIAGAGLGILSTKITYLVYPYIKRKLFKNDSSKALVLPAYKPEFIGFNLK